MQNINKDYFLLEKLKKGDSKAYSFLMDSYYKRLCGYANSISFSSSMEIGHILLKSIMLQRWKLFGFGCILKFYCTLVSEPGRDNSWTIRICLECVARALRRT